MGRTRVRQVRPSRDADQGNATTREGAPFGCQRGPPNNLGRETLSLLNGRRVSQWRGASGSVPSDQVTGLEQAAGARASRHPLSTLCEHPAPLVLIVSQQDTLHTHKSGRVKNTSKGFSPARLSLLRAVVVRLLLRNWQSVQLLPTNVGDELHYARPRAFSLAARRSHDVCSPPSHPGVCYHDMRAHGAVSTRL